MVDKHGTTSITIPVTGSAITINTTATHGGDIVIDRDALTRGKVICFKDRLRRVYCRLGGLCWGTYASFGEETGGTFAFKCFDCRGTWVRHG
jgi:hypothetical protein